MMKKVEEEPFNLGLLSNHDLFTLGFLRTRQTLTLRTERVIIHVAAGPYMCKQVIIHFSNEIMLRNVHLWDRIGAICLATYGNIFKSRHKKEWAIPSCFV